ncbi:hypothetical protein GCM10023178_18950 [Actinomadura luteofluorescens]
MVATSEKRKVGGSTPPLPTTKTSDNAPEPHGPGHLFLAATGAGKRSGGPPPTGASYERQHRDDHTRPGRRRRTGRGRVRAPSRRHFGLTFLAKDTLTPH